MVGGSTTTLGYAILRLLSREELSGYDLSSRMKTRVGFFWEARHSQIYPELARLEARGLVTHHVVEQADRPDEKVYKVTASGLDALKEWATQLPARRATSLCSRRTPSGSPKKAVALFKDRERLYEELLHEYESIESWMEKEWGKDVLRTDSPRLATRRCSAASSTNAGTRSGATGSRTG